HHAGNPAAAFAGLTRLTKANRRSIDGGASMLAEVVDAIVKLMLFVSMVSATQLVAAWAVVSRRPLAWRLAVPIVGMFSLWIGWRATEEPDNAGAMITLLSLEMLKVALVLAIAKGIAQHGL